MISSNVKMAIIGAGTWGKNHAQIYNAHPFAETVAICDANLSKGAGRSAGARHSPSVSGLS